MYIPPGSLVVVYPGDDAPLRFLSPNGDILEAPTSSPSPGEGTAGIIGVKQTVDDVVTNTFYAVCGANNPEFPTGVGLYYTDFSGTISADFASGSNGIGRDNLGNFYTCGYNTFFKYSASGEPFGELVETYTTSGNGYDGSITAIAVNPEGTTAYCVRSSLPGSPTVFKWDLVNDTFDGVFFTGDVGYKIWSNGIFCLSNGDVVIALDTGLGADPEALSYFGHFDSSGTLLHKYLESNIGANVVIEGLGGTSIWVSYFGGPSADVTTFAEIELGTGDVLRSFEPDESQGFLYGGPFALIAEPIGISVFCKDLSCSGFCAELSCGDGPSIRAIRRLRQAPYVSTENNRIVFDQFRVDMEVDEGWKTLLDRNPRVALQWSDDLGESWSPAKWMSVASVLDHVHEVKWNRLGQSRQRAFRVWMDDPVDMSLINSYLRLRPGAT